MTRQANGDDAHRSVASRQTNGDFHFYVFFFALNVAILSSSRFRPRLGEITRCPGWHLAAPRPHKCRTYCSLSQLAARFQSLTSAMIGNEIRFRLHETIHQSDCNTAFTEAEIFAQFAAVIHDLIAVKLNIVVAVAKPVLKNQMRNCT